jgi:predicted permease
VLLAASGLLFVIACSNVANLILARTVRRESELAVRSALGATPAAIRRSLLAEGLVLCGSGGLAGVLLAVPMFTVLARYAARFSVRAADLSLDFSALAVGFVLALAAAVFLAMVPRLPSADAPRGLGLSGVRVTGTSNRRLRVFAITQIAASFLLLSGAAVLLRTLLALERTQPGFETDHVLAVNLPLMSDGRTPQQIDEFYREAQLRVSELPGVERVATGMSAPWRDGQFLGFTLQFSVEGLKRENGRDDPRARFRSVSPGYFGTLGIPILEGRDFNDADRKGAETVVIVSKSVAQQLFPGQEAVDRHLMWTDPVLKFIGMSSEPRRIVGVVADLDDENIIPAPNLTVYQPFQQGDVWTARLFVRAANDPYTLVPTITRTVHALAGDQPVEHASTLGDVRAEVLSPNRLNAIVFGGFAALALLISVVGVAGVLAFAVSWRAREFGIRLALGARPRQILAGVLKDGVVIAAIGVAAGALAGFALSRAIGSYVQELQQPGPLPLILSAVVILAAAVLAAVVPAGRAAGVDTVRALRAD